MQILCISIFIIAVNDLILNITLTTSCSGISIGFPVKNDVKIPFLVIGAVGSGPGSLEESFSPDSLAWPKIFNRKPKDPC